VTGELLSVAHIGISVCLSVCLFVCYTLVLYSNDRLLWWTVKVVVGMCKQIWHHTLIGFDEFLGTATYEKVDETAATTSAVVAQVPVVVTRKKSKQSSSAAAADPAQEFNGRVTIEVTTRRKLDAL